MEHTTLIEPEMVTLPSESGKPQVVARCPACKIAVWSNYGGSGDFLRFVKVGTLDNPDTCPPDIHIFTSTKQPWIKLNDNIPAVEEYYDRADYWPKEALERRELVIADMKAAKRTEEGLAKKTKNVQL